VSTSTRSARAVSRRRRAVLREDRRLHQRART
jgi:hypothetical protein